MKLAPLTAAAFGKKSLDNLGYTYRVRNSWRLDPVAVAVLPCGARQAFISAAQTPLLTIGPIGARLSMQALEMK